MNQDNEKIIHKIKRCLALSKSSNENEAATALRQAHAMMAKYDISMTDIQASDIKACESNVKTGAKPNRYQVLLIDMIARLFGCAYYLSRALVVKNGKNQWRSSWVFYGLDGYAEIAGYVFETLDRQIKQARRDYMKSELRLVRIAKNRYTRADAFCHGWVKSVSEKVEGLVPPNVDVAFIKYQVNKSHDNIKTRHAKDTLKNAKKELVANDYFNGVAEGRNAQLHHAMNTHKGVGGTFVSVKV